MNLIAVLMTLRLLHAVADSLNTSLSTHKSKAAKKHFSAISSSAVRISANKYKRSGWSRKMAQKSEWVA